jgi:hypothetical protein
VSAHYPVPMSERARNILIVLLVAAAVWALPGGGKAASLVAAILGLLITVAFVWLGARLYQQHRMDIYGLGDRYRALLYGAIGVAVLTIAATSRLWATGAGSLVWIALIGGASYAVLVVFRRWRSVS